MVGMNLSEYISTSRGKAADLADKLGISPAAVSYWVSGDRLPNIENCKRIEFFTGGDVRCEDLRPDLNWSHLRSRSV